MERVKETWKDLDLRTRIAYTTAIAAFVIGWGLTIAAFFVTPIGIVSDSVLWVLGQALTYAAAVLGVGMYTVSSVRRMRTEIRGFMRGYQQGENADYEGENHLEE